MDINSLPAQSQTAASDGAPIPSAGSSIPKFADDIERRNWLIDTLGEPFCRKLGIYRIPADLTLSVVIPAYNEKKTIREILRRVRRPDSQGNHRRQRLLDRRHARDPP